MSENIRWQTVKIRKPYLCPLCNRKIPMARNTAIERARRGDIVYLVHYYKGKKILKIMCADRHKLINWAIQHSIPKSWLHISRSGLPHFDLWGSNFTKIIKKG